MVTNSQVRYGHDLYGWPNKTWLHNGRGFGRHGSRGVIFGGGPLWPEKIEAGIYPLQRHHSPGFEAGQYPGGWIMAVHCIIDHGCFFLYGFYVFLVSFHPKNSNSNLLRSCFISQLFWVTHWYTWRWKWQESSSSMNRVCATKAASTPEKLEVKLSDFGHSRLINDGALVNILRTTSS